jgi:hypothetical protein
MSEWLQTFPIPQKIACVDLPFCSCDFHFKLKCTSDFWPRLPFEGPMFEVHRPGPAEIYDNVNRPNGRSGPNGVGAEKPSAYSRWIPASSGAEVDIVHITVFNDPFLSKPSLRSEFCISKFFWRDRLNQIHVFDLTTNPMHFSH